MDMFSLLPVEMPMLWQLVILIFTSFIGSAMTATFSIGGGILVIATMSAILPAPVVVPVHGAILLGSNVGRVALLFRYIDWQIWLWFLVGALVGGIVGALVITDIPGSLLRLSIAIFVLYTQWGPKLKPLLAGGKGYAVMGLLSTFLTLFIGATGPFVTAAISHVSMTRQAFVGTAGACMSVQHAIKVTVFVITGFAFAPWLPFIAVMIISGFCGTVFGTRILGRLDEVKFRQILKWLLTALAAMLIVMAGLDLF